MQYNKIIEQANETQRNALGVIMEAQKMKENAAKVSGEKLNESEVVMIPLASYEMQQDRFQEEREKAEERHEAEKDKMRKHYRKIIAWIASILIVMIVGIFGTAIWFFGNYDVLSVSQDGNGLNNYAYGTEQGDVTYGATHPDDSTKEVQES